MAYPKCNTRQISERCGLSKSEVWKILQESSSYPYRPKLQHILLDGDAKQCYSWCNFVMNQMQVQQTFLPHVVWTEEAYFSQNGMYNSQHTHYWALENSILFTYVHHQVWFGTNIWWAIYNNKLICPIFYDGILTGAWYLQLLQNVMLNFFGEPSSVSSEECTVST